MTLGEFNLEHLQDSEYLPFPAILFIFFTFIIQIVLLNMLIAIMADTFEQVSQQQHLQLMRERLIIIQENAYLFKSKEDTRFLFMVDPVNLASQDKGWQGKLANLIKQYEIGTKQI